MSTTMVFIHGRGQEFKDPVKLLASWRAGLATGLAAAGLDGLADVPAVLPFYGNVLAQITGKLEQSQIDLESLPADPDQPGPLHPALGKDVGDIERELMGDLLAQRANPDQEGLSFAGLAGKALSWGVVRSGLIGLAKSTGVDREIIKGFLKDVAVYLAGAGARSAVLDVVHQGIPADGPIVLVSHSLGTAVACDLLEDAAIRSRTTAWVTLGSPLGLPVVRRNLLGKGVHPADIDWQTGYDTNDVVALGHPLLPIWGEALADVQVENGDAPHSIERYLGHPDIARFIHTAARA